MRVSRELLLERVEKIKRFEWFQIVEIGAAKRVENFLIDGCEHNRLRGRRGARRKLLGQLVLTFFVLGEDFAGAFDDGERAGRRDARLRCRNSCRRCRARRGEEK